MRTSIWSIPVVVVVLCCARPASADQVITDDLIVQGSACVGFDCVNGEVFGFDTVKLKENNTRLKFDDTSNSASFPNNDWQLTANDSTNGGANKFSIEDVSGGRIPFTIEASAPNNSLFVDNGGRIGLSTNNPVVELHVVDGDSPTLRLEQDGSSGFTPQTWDVAGNETNFFVRDATNGSRLPFRIRPSAPSQSLYIDTDGDIGLGTSSPAQELHVNRSDATQTALLVQNTNGSAQQVQVGLQNTQATWNINNTIAGTLQLTRDGSGGAEFGIATNGTVTMMDGATNNFTLDGPTGNLTIRGDINSGGTTVVPDYVFEKDYKLMTLSQVAAYVEREKHLPNVPSAKEINEGGLNMTEMQMKLLEKVEELTLYTIEQEKQIEQQSRLIRDLQAKVSP